MLLNLLQIGLHHIHHIHGILEVVRIHCIFLILNVLPQFPGQAQGKMGKIVDVVHGVQDTVYEALGKLTDSGLTLLPEQFVLGLAQLLGTLVHNGLQALLFLCHATHAVPEKQINKEDDDNQVQQEGIPAYEHRIGLLEI